MNFMDFVHTKTVFLVSNDRILLKFGKFKVKNS